MGLNTNEIISGYQKGMKECLRLLETLSIDDLKGKWDKEKLARAITGPIASKQYGVEQFLAPLVAEACLTVMPKDPTNFNVDNVRVGNNQKNISILYICKNKIIFKCIYMSHITLQCSYLLVSFVFSF